MLDLLLFVCAVVFVLIMFIVVCFHRPFSLDNFTDYEKHFTVMNYRDESELNQIHYDEFVPLFEEQYPEHKWSSIQVKQEYSQKIHTNLSVNGLSANTTDVSKMFMKVALPISY